MDAFAQELDRLREENKSLKRKADTLYRQLQGAERAAALAGALDHTLDIPHRRQRLAQRLPARHLEPGLPVYNRHYLLDALEREFRRNARAKTDMCCALLAADVPDHNLGPLAVLLHDNLRSEDVIGLWEEQTFKLVLSRTSMQDGEALVDYLRAQTMENMRLTMSAGLTDLRAGAPKTAAEMLENTRAALQLAREAGGNRTVMYNSMPL
jgi:GGDEF domain-containing protein